MLTIDCHNHVGIEPIHYYTNSFPYCQHLSTMVEEGKSLGVDHWIVFPFVTNLGLDQEALRENRIADNPNGNVPYEFENRALMYEVYRLFPDEGAKTLPFAMFDPTRKVPEQVAALRELRREYLFYGLKAQTTIIQSPIKNLLKDGKALLELAEEWDIPILLHSSYLKEDIWAQAKDILDVVEVTPNVRFCVAHSLRFNRVQLDRLNDLPNAWFDCSAHRIHCQLAVRNSPLIAPPNLRFKSDYTRASHVLRDLAETYPKKLMWGSDSPFYSYVAEYNNAMFRLMSSYALEVAALRGIPTETQQQIAETNTLNFLKLKVPATEEQTSETQHEKL